MKTGFKVVYDGGEFEVIGVFGGCDEHLTFVDSFRAAMLFICARRQVAFPKSQSFTIQFIAALPE
jgi:hypothetical protein